MTVLGAFADLDRELAERGVTLHLAALPKSAYKVAAREQHYAGMIAGGRIHETVQQGVVAASAGAEHHDS